MQLIPRRRAYELLDEFRLADEREALDELSMARFRNEALELRSSDRFASTLLLGMIAARQGDEIEARKQHKLAVDLEPKEVVAWANFSISMFGLGYVNEARAIAIEALALAPADKGLLAMVNEFTVSSSRFSEALAQFTEFRTKLGEQRLPAEKWNIPAIIQFLSSREISETQIQELEELALRQLRRKGMTLKSVHFLLMHDEDSEWFSGWLGVLADVDVIVELNWTLAEAIAEASSLTAFHEKVNVMFVPHQKRK